MAEQTKADRQEAAQKAAATRKRKEVRSDSSERGTKAAATRQGNAAADSLDQAKRAAGSAAGGLVSAGKLVGNAATEAGKSVLTRARGVTGR